jgi:hypothetical protein
MQCMNPCKILLQTASAHTSIPREPKVKYLRTPPLVKAEGQRKKKRFHPSRDLPKGTYHVRYPGSCARKGKAKGLKVKLN